MEGMKECAIHIMKGNVFTESQLNGTDNHIYKIASQ